MFVSQEAPQSLGKLVKVRQRRTEKPRKLLVAVAREIRNEFPPILIQLCG
jgi:hypothetical protein